MSIKNKLTYTLLLISSCFYAQETASVVDTIVKKEVKISFLDSIKATFIKDDMATCVDSLWMQELTSLDLYNEMITDIKTVDTDATVDFELPTELLKQRLRLLDEKSPFNIEYNVGLENVIKSFLKNRKRGFERLMGLSQFYFPVFEEHLAKNNIPLEIKYLAIVESALNPKAVSRMGATGLWQFMYHTGKQYGLKIDSYVDERSDPFRASEAASQYMTNMYKMFGDWDLVLASYNSGPGNVAKAIRRSGGRQNFWNIKKFLPKETQGYLPAFLATMYIFEYHKEHGIVPNRAIANHFATDTIAIKRHITFKQISDLLSIPEVEIQFFNPSYKRNEIPYITGSLNFLKLPKDKIAAFASNEDKIYAYVDYVAKNRERPMEDVAYTKPKDTISGAIASLTKYHKIRKGENLTLISRKYNVSVADLKRWNGLQSNSAPLGRNLKIYSFEKTPLIETKTDVAVAEVKSNKEESVKTSSETAEKITERESYYVVAKGDNLTSIARNQGVTVQQLKEWNNLFDNTVKVGTQIIISNKSLSDKNTSVAVETKTKEHTVQKGDNLVQIAKKYNTSVENLREWNSIQGNNIQLGATLIVAKTEVAVIDKSTKSKKEVLQTEKESSYYVKRGDSLYSISQKFPGVSIADIKKWNNIKDESIKPGMKLKIGG
jgi:membrane-bound lytic murein transglycosylase D